MKAKVRKLSLVFSALYIAFVILFASEYFPLVKCSDFDMSYKAFLTSSQFCRFQEVNSLLFGFHGVRPVQQALVSATHWADKFSMRTAGGITDIPSIAGPTWVFPCVFPGHDIHLSLKLKTHTSSILLARAV